MKERVEKALQTTYVARTPDGRLPLPGEAVEAHLQLGMPIEEIIPLIGELWADNQALRAEREGMLGASELNRLVVMDLQEKLRVAEEALDYTDRFLSSLELWPGGIANTQGSIWKALSTIRGK